MLEVNTPYNFIVGSYDIIQHVITIDLDLVQFYLGIGFTKPHANQM